MIREVLLRLKSKEGLPQSDSDFEAAFFKKLITHQKEKKHLWSVFMFKAPGSHTCKIPAQIEIRAMGNEVNPGNGLPVTSSNDFLDFFVTKHNLR